MALLYGFDASTSVVGIACLSPAGSLVRSWHCDLRKVEGLIEKARAVQDLVRREVEPSSDCFVEERLGGFSGGRTSAQVLMKLGAFNALVQFVLAERGCSVRTIHPSTWKSLLRREGLLTPKGTPSDQKKQLVLDFVVSREPGFRVELNRNGKPQPWCYDRADAVCIARAGWKQLQAERADGSREEAGGAAEVPEERGPGDR